MSYRTSILVFAVLCVGPSGLPKQQVARSLATRIRETSEIMAGVWASGEGRAQRR